VAEVGWGVGEPERHHCELIVAVVGAECCLWDIFLGNADLAASAADVDFGEDIGAVKLIQDRFDSGQG
jgi:hypothetical protein